MNICIFSGNVGSAPEVKTTESGLTIARFSLAVNEYRKNESGERETVTNWFRFVAFGKSAETISKFVDKGSRLTIQAKAVVNKWITEDGENRSAVEFILQNFEFAGSNNKPEEGSEEGSEKNISSPEALMTSEEDDDLPF
jgi:single-strand DNA-binding protein